MHTYYIQVNDTANILPGVVVQLIVDEVSSTWIFNASYSTETVKFTIGAV